LVLEPRYNQDHYKRFSSSGLYSNIPIVILVLLVLNNVPVWVENVLHLAGGLFVLFLAWGAFKSAIRYSMNEASLVKSASQNFLKAVTVNLLNPNPYIQWSLVMGPFVIQGWRELPVNGAGLVIAFYFAMIATTILIIFIFSAIRRSGFKINRILIGVSGVALTCFGLYQLWLGISRLWFN
jgi:threonine/homoserine/homoserine lactone efflux protein